MIPLYYYSVETSPWGSKVFWKTEERKVYSLRKDGSWEFRWELREGEKLGMVTQCEAEEACGEVAA